MDLPDITRIIMSYLDDATIGALVRAGASYNASTFTDQAFWHDRVETLTGVVVGNSDAVDWNETYQILKRELQRSGAPAFWNGRDNVMVLRLLLAMGYRTEDSYGSLSQAVELGLINTLRFLLAEGGIDPNDLGPMDRYPPLTLACDNAEVEAVRLLLADPRIDANIETGGTTPLMQACCVTYPQLLERYVEVVRLLLKDGRADPTEGDSAAFASSAESGDRPEIVQLLLKDGRADPDANDGEPLIELIGEEATQSLALVLQDPRTRPWCRDGEAIVLACEVTNPAVVQLLLEDGRVDPNSQNGRAILEAVSPRASRDEANALEILRLLLADDRTAPELNNNAALEEAIRTNNAAAVKLLLSNEAVLTELNTEMLDLAEHRFAGQQSDIPQLVRSALQRY